MHRKDFSFKPTLENLPWMASFIGAAVALWVILMAHGVINRDGTLYIRVAALFLEGKWEDGIGLYNWPLYPLLIAGVHQFTGLSLQNSGHALAIFFYSLASGVFTLILRESGGSRNVMLAGIALWFSSPYLVGDIVPMIVREHGFWLFLLGGLWCLLRFAKTHQWRHAIGWGICAIFATLFRIEAITFLILLPIAFLMQPGWDWKTRIYRTLQSHAILLGTGAAMAAILLTHPAIALNDLGRLHEPFDYISNISHEINQNLENKSSIFADQVLGSFLDNYARSGLLLTLSWILIVKIIGTAGMMQSMLFLPALIGKKPLPASSALPLLVIFGIISLANSSFILISKFLLAGRMASPIAFSIIAFAAFFLAKVYEDWRSDRYSKRLTPIFLALVLCIQFALSLWPPSSKSDYEVRAAEWVVTHKRPSEKVFYDHPRMYHYAGENFPSLKQDLDWPDIFALFDEHTITNYNYLVIHGHKRKPEQEAFITNRLGLPLMRFDNGRSGEIIIYRVPENLARAQ